MIIFITRFATSCPRIIWSLCLISLEIRAADDAVDTQYTSQQLGAQYLRLECYDPAALCVTCAYWKLILAGQLISGLQQQHINTIWSMQHSKNISRLPKIFESFPPLAPETVRQVLQRPELVLARMSGLLSQTEAVSGGREAEVSSTTWVIWILELQTKAFRRYANISKS